MFYKGISFRKNKRNVGRNWQQIVIASGRWLKEKKQTVARAGRRRSRRVIEYHPMAAGRSVNSFSRERERRRKSGGGR